MLSRSKISRLYHEVWFGLLKEIEEQIHQFDYDATVIRTNNTDNNNDQRNNGNCLGYK